MDQATYQQWWQLHLRVARGEALGSDERSRYDRGRHEIEQDEPLPGQADAKQARQEWIAIQRQHSELEKRRQSLDSEIVQLESQLNDQTRHYLGVED